jgi:hypothetical protein
VQQYGAEVILVHDEGNIGKCIEDCINLALKMQEEDPKVFVPQQFENPANPAIQRSGTGMEILAQVVYTALLPYMEEANRSYEKTVAAALKGAQARWGTPPSALTPGMPRDAAGIPPHAGGIKKIPEEEAEADEEADQKKNESIRPFRPPTAAEVHRECVQKGYRNIDPERFVSYYASTGWRRGTTPITDWRSALHSWSLQKAPVQKNTGGLDRLAQLYKEDNL